MRHVLKIYLAYTVDLDILMVVVSSFMDSYLSSSAKQLQQVCFPCFIIISNLNQRGSVQDFITLQCCKVTQLNDVDALQW